MKIAVNQEHIDRGTPEEAELCPIALAIKDTLGQSVMVDIWNGGTYAEVIETGTRFRLSRTVTEFIVAFDDDKKVHPFNFILNMNKPQ